MKNEYLIIRLGIVNKHVLVSASNEDSTIVWRNGEGEKLEIFKLDLQNGRDRLTSTVENFVHSPNEDRPITIASGDQQRSIVGELEGSDDTRMASQIFAVHRLAALEQFRRKSRSRRLNSNCCCIAYSCCNIFNWVATH